MILGDPVKGSLHYKGLRTTVLEAEAETGAKVQNSLQCSEEKETRGPVRHT